MNIKVQKFIVGGLGCVAPNIVNYASTAVSGSAIPGNLVSTMLGAVIFFLLAGFLVSFILEAKDIKDAFYKGVAIPTLIISLANGATSTFEKKTVPVLPTTPAGSYGMMMPPDSVGVSLSSFTLVAAAEAQESTMDSARMGTIRFEVSPATSDIITVTLSARDGTILAQARSAVPSFSIRYIEGSYIAHVETASSQARQEVTVQRNETTVARIKLEKKGFLKDLSQGVQNLMKR